MKDVFITELGQTVFKQKYSMNGTELWKDTAKRVTDSVCAQLVDNKTKDKIYNIINERKFIPGGRYLYSSGRSFHQVNNCFYSELKILENNGQMLYKSLVLH